MNFNSIFGSPPYTTYAAPLWGPGSGALADVMDGDAKRPLTPLRVSEGGVQIENAPAARQLFSTRLQGSMAALKAVQLALRNLGQSGAWSALHSKALQTHLHVLHGQRASLQELRRNAHGATRREADFIWRATKLVDSTPAIWEYHRSMNDEGAAVQAVLLRLNPIIADSSNA